MCTLCDLSINFSFYFSLANWRYFYNITCVWETFDKSCLLSFQFHYLHMTVALEVLSLHNSSIISFLLCKLESFLHMFFFFFWEPIDKSGFSVIPIWIFAHENSVESLFLDAPYSIISLQFCKLGSFYTTQNVFGKHLASLFNKKPQQKLIELWKHW